MVTALAAKVPAVAPATAARPVTVKSEPSKPLEYSPGVAELSPAERRKAFMAAPAAIPAEKSDNGEPTEEQAEDLEIGELGSKEAAVQNTEEQADPNAADASKGEPEDELVSGLAKHAEKHPELKAILKRTQTVLKQNSERGKEIEALKAEVETHRAKPAAVLAPSADSPLAHVVTPEQVDAEVKAITNEARNRIRWLERHLEGGTWNEGTEHAQELTAAQVESALNHYEDMRDGAAALGTQRKAELAEYAATLKTLNVPAEDLVKPAVPTRESKLFAKVPELMRDPTYLQILADAKAGREAREEAARGVRTVKVDPGKVKPVAKASSNEGSEGDGNTPRVVTPSTTDLAQLRSQAAAGDADARAAIRRAFVRQID